MANLFIKMLEKFCQGTVFVQTKSKQRGQKTKNKNNNNKRKNQGATAGRSGNEEMSEIDKVRTAEQSVEQCY